MPFGCDAKYTGANFIDILSLFIHVLLYDNFVRFEAHE